MEKKTFFKVSNKFSYFFSRNGSYFVLNYLSKDLIACFFHGGREILFEVLSNIWNFFSKKLKFQYVKG